MIRRLWLLLTILGICMSPRAAEVLSILDGRELNASLIEPGRDHAEAFLVIHGTWAHHRMETIQAIQQGLAERGIASLAPTLSLGISDRKGMLACNATMILDETTVDAEIRHWVGYLLGKGYRTVTLMGHSRGAQQAMRYIIEQADSRVTGLVMLGSMTWRADEVKARYDTQRAGTFDALLEEARRAPQAMMGPLTLYNCNGVRTTGNSFLAYYDPRIVRHTPDLVEHVRIRTDIVLGTDDEVARWHPDDIAKARLRRNVRLLAVDGADHFFRDLYMDEVLDAILLPTVDLSSLSSERVHVLFIALSDCPVCRRMEAEVLYPLLRSGALDGRAEVTQLLLDDPRLITGFKGDPVDTNTFAEFYSARMTPTLLFLDSTGIPLVPAITGYNGADFYADRVERAIDLAYAELAGNPATN